MNKELEQSKDEKPRLKGRLGVRTGSYAPVIRAGVVAQPPEPEEPE